MERKISNTVDTTVGLSNKRGREGWEKERELNLWSSQKCLSTSPSSPFIGEVGEKILFMPLVGFVFTKMLLKTTNVSVSNLTNTRWANLECNHINQPWTSNFPHNPDWFENKFELELVWSKESLIFSNENAGPLVCIIFTIDAYLRYGYKGPLYLVAASACGCLIHFFMSCT